MIAKGAASNLRLAVDRDTLCSYSVTLPQQTKGKTQAKEDDTFHSTLILPKLHIGPYILDDVIVTFPSMPVNSRIKAEAGPAQTGTRFKKNESYKGLIGYDVLKHFTITLDAKTPKLHIYAE